MSLASFVFEPTTPLFVGSFLTLCHLCCPQLEKADGRGVSEKGVTHEPDRWAKLEELFQATLDMAFEERNNFLAAASADDAQIHAEVQTLIEKYQASSSFLNSSSATFDSSSNLKERAIEISPGDHLAHFEIISLLGSGGMGEVYLARDPRLERNVALKVLPPLLREDVALRERLQFEARAVSALNHPHIITVFDIGEASGTQFVATEYVEGMTLRAYLRANRMTFLQSIDVAMQIASALSRRHILPGLFIET
jgi:hypothetical protein